MSNLFQRIINLCAIMCGAQCYFVEAPTEIIQRLPEIRPALFIGVPRFFEKLHAGIQAELSKKPRLVQWLVGKAWAIGEQYGGQVRRGNQVTGTLRISHAMADFFILQRLRRVMGPDIQFMVSGSAPMPVWLLERMHGLGWLVLEAYGISECVIPIATGTLEAYRFGSVGRPLPENEIRLAEDSELLVRGNGVFRGYWGGDTADSPIDAEGFLHTGDFARLDEQGFLYLTGRKSEVFKTSTGRRIAPVPVEALVKQLPYVDHAVTFGRNRAVPGMLISIHPQWTFDEKGGGRLAPNVLEEIGRDVGQMCNALPSYQRPAGILVSRRAFSIEGGELTSNLKLRRGRIEEKYLTEIDALYAALAERGERSQAMVREVS